MVSSKASEEARRIWNSGLFPPTRQAETERGGRRVVGYCSGHQDSREEKNSEMTKEGGRGGGREPQTSTHSPRPLVWPRSGHVLSRFVDKRPTGRAHPHKTTPRFGRFSPPEMPIALAHASRLGVNPGPTGAGPSRPGARLSPRSASLGLGSMFGSEMVYLESQMARGVIIDRLFGRMRRGGRYRRCGAVGKPVTSCRLHSVVVYSQSIATRDMESRSEVEKEFPGRRRLGWWHGPWSIRD